MHVRLYSFQTAAAVVAIAMLSACGGGSSATSSATATPMSEMQREQAALPQTQQAPVPKDLHCGTGETVWVNTHTKTYHESGDPYYGRTKSGEYLCQAQADQQGYRAAGAHRTHSHNSMNGSMENQMQSSGGMSGSTSSP